MLESGEVFMARKDLLSLVVADQKKKAIVDFRAGDTVKVHARIVEGQKERIQIFEGMVIKRNGRNGMNASFTVRKVSYNVGVERTFLLHSPRVEKIVVVSRGEVRRSRLFYLRPLRGKAAKIQSELVTGEEATGKGVDEIAETAVSEQPTNIESPVPTEDEVAVAQEGASA